MHLTNKNILLISPEAWEHIFVSKHHYAIHLAKLGNKVFFLNPPKNRLLINTTEFDNVWSVNYTRFMKGIRFYPVFIQKWILHRKFCQLQVLCNIKFDIVWSFDNSVFYDFNALPESVLKINHIVDLNQDFQTGKAARTANICFGVTNSIIDRLKSFQVHSYFINHGFNINLNYVSKEFSLPGENIIKAIYAGNLLMAYLDWSIIYIIAKKNPAVDFIFIGPNGEKFNFSQNITHYSKKACAKMNNAYFIGELAADELRFWYDKSDILLISYQEKYHMEQSNPHKMMEYLGSGKVVIATKTLEYNLLSDQNLIAMSERNEAFPQLFTSVVKNIKNWNSKDKSKQRIDYALENTYYKQLERIERLINKIQT